jgi:hypothetical protein
LSFDVTTRPDPAATGGAIRELIVLGVSNDLADVSTDETANAGESVKQDGTPA